MTTLATIRARVRRDLHDTDSENYRWPDDQVDRHIERALHDFSLAIPREAQATVATTPGSLVLSLAALDGLIAVEAIEFPEGVPQPFTTWAGDLTLAGAPETDGSDALVRYLATHVLDEEGSTIPPALEDVLATGASGYAAMELAGAGIDRLSVSGQAPRDFAAWGQAWLVAFRELLHQHGRGARLRERRLSRPA